MRLYLPFKALMDRAFSLLLLLLLWPLLLLIAAAVRLSMGRPVFFSQPRAGRGGAPFTVRKFRTMKAGVGGDGERITPLGALLRRTGLDELPQLWSILRGEMSFIGPRPLPLEYLPLYTPEQSRRHEVWPGLSGWAQVNGRNRIDWDEKLRLDVEYVDNISLFRDIRILFLTARCVLWRGDENHARGLTMPVFTGSPKASLLILGAGGHGRSVADAAAQSGLYRRIAYLDDWERTADFPVLGDFDRLTELREEFHNAVAAVGDCELRLSLLDRLTAAGYSLPALIHPRACVCRGAEMGEGTVLLAGAVLGAGAVCGRGCILNTCSSADHDCRLGDGVHLCPGSHAAGDVTIGRCAVISTGVSLGRGARVGDGAVVGAGAVVLSEVPAGVLAAGAPARIVRPLTGEKPQKSEELP